MQIKIGFATSFEASSWHKRSENTGHTGNLFLSVFDVLPVSHEETD